METTKERVTLILGEERIEAYRDDLSSKSDYFASLFSPNFCDTLSTEHRINYEIDAKTLRTFVSWTSESANSTFADIRRVKRSLSRYASQYSSLDDVPELLELGVLFAAEELTKDLTNIIACRRLDPEKSIQFWRLAKELNLLVLRDLAKASCLEHLSEGLHCSTYLELPEEEFLDLVGSACNQSSLNFLLEITKQWLERNVPSGEIDRFKLHFPFMLLEKDALDNDRTKKINEQRLKSNAQCVVGYKVIGENQQQACIYCWDGSKFFEVAEIPKFSNVSTKNIEGRQAVGRGYDIYIIGGEYGIGTGLFEKEIWRYSTITKSWYYVTSLREPRRHMAVAFLNNRLYVMGGVGRRRLKLSTVDVYNVHQDRWSKAADVPEEFTSVPMTVEYNEKLMIYKSALYTYDPRKNNWQTICCDFRGFRNASSLATKPISIQYIAWWNDSTYIIDCNNPKYAQVWIQGDLSNYPATWFSDCASAFSNVVTNGPYLIGFSQSEDTVYIETMMLTRDRYTKMRMRYSQDGTGIRNLCVDSPIGCFNIINSCKLNERLLIDIDASNKTRRY
ncbi:kelch-like protein 22 isoform X1 [Neodiprion fabricii]|uniref:kelch-like protein 22 isoform X1 n=1 Tax=Neodiprion fabricii TaxID=2872261 RepID=UPI001ED8ED66|nr:kelch-like protein 22 isoform X1 [Neodiprion fabricii]